MVNISKQDNAIIFAFTDSQYYLFGTGSIEVPMNALSLVIDESDMITFRKASSNDIFVSIPLDETNFSTKADVIDFYKENMVGSSGSADAFTGVSYDGTNQEIIFTNKDDEEVATLDASAFVIDGMVENVKVENGYLVIDFNTASGKQDIYIPLTSFFDASQYYTKTEVDNKLSDYATKSEVDEKTTICEYGGWYETSGTFLQGQWYAVEVNSNLPKHIFYFRIKLDSTNVNIGVKAVNNVITFIDGSGTVIDRPSYISSDSYYDSVENKFYVYLTDNYIDYVGNTQEYALRLATTNECQSIKDYISELPDMTNYYDKSETDNKFLTKAVFDVKEEVISDALNQLDEDKVDASDLATVATSGSYNDLTNKPTIPAAQVQANWNESDSSSMAYIQNKPTIPDTSNFVTVSQYNPKEQAIAEALTELNDNKVDASDLATVATSGSYNDLSNKPVIPDVSNYLTKSEFEVKEEVIARALNTLNSEMGDVQTILQSI